MIPRFGIKNKSIILHILWHYYYGINHILFSTFLTCSSNAGNIPK